MRKFMPIVALALAAAACSSVTKVVSQDMPLEVQHQILDEYKDRYVWTRVTIQDLGEGGTIPRDEKVKIVDVGMFKAGSVTVETMKKKNRVVQGSSLDKPLTKAKIDSSTDGALLVRRSHAAPRRVHSQVRQGHGQSDHEPRIVRGDVARRGARLVGQAAQGRALGTQRRRTGALALPDCHRGEDERRSVRKRKGEDLGRVGYALPGRRDHAQDFFGGRTAG